MSNLRVPVPPLLHRRDEEGNVGRKKEIVETEGYELPRYNQESEWKDTPDRSADEAFVKEAREYNLGGAKGLATETKLEAGEVEGDEIEGLTVGFNKAVGKGGMEWNINKALSVMQRKMHVNEEKKEEVGGEAGGGESSAVSNNNANDKNESNGGYEKIEYKPLTMEELEEAGMKGPPVVKVKDVTAKEGHKSAGKKKKKAPTRTAVQNSKGLKLMQFLEKVNSKGEDGTSTGMLNMSGAMEITRNAMDEWTKAPPGIVRSEEMQKLMKEKVRPYPYLS
jgi:hypothetical protein